MLLNIGHDDKLIITNRLGENTLKWQEQRFWFNLPTPPYFLPNPKLPNLGIKS